MKTFVPGYYVLEQPERGKWTRYFKDAFLLFNWVLSYIGRRSIINVALGPDEIRLQTPIHVMYLTDDRTEKGSVIVNLLAAKSSKTPKSYFDKLPRFSSKTKRQLSFDNPKHRKQVDFVIDEIGLLLAGTCGFDKCKDKKFAIENIHLKGLERLDERLAEYFKEQVCQKYGDDFFEHPRKSSLDFYTLETADNALLESVAVSTSKEQQKPMAERKFVISCMARNQNYMYWLKDFYTSAQNIGCTVIGFNYRGIDYSKGMIWTDGNMVDDAMAQAQRLIESGVKPENIAFEGMSMGAAVATIAAAKMHDKGLKVSLYNERSYRSLIHLMIGYVMPNRKSNPWSPLTWIKYAVVGLAYIILAPAIYFFGWHLDAAGAWDRIPPEYKSYSVARNHKDPAQDDDDDLVHDSYGSIASLMDQHIEEIKQKQKSGKPLTVEEEQLLADKPESHEFTLDRSNKANPNPSPHAAPRRFMFDTQNHKQTMHGYMTEHLREMLHISSSELETVENPEQDGESLIKRVA